MAAVAGAELVGASRLLRWICVPIATHANAVVRLSSAFEDVCAPHALGRTWTVVQS